MRKSGKYPMANESMCISAVKLRHHGKGVTAREVLDKASAAASWERCKVAVAKARKADKS